MIKFESEKHLEDFICGKLDEGKAIIDNIDFDTYKRQYKCGSYGIADVVVFNCVKHKGSPEILEIYIYELKNENFNVKHLTQVSRYYTYFSRLAYELYPDTNISIYPSVVCLEGDCLSEDDYICNVDDLSIPVYKYSICPSNGFSISIANGVKLSNENLVHCDHIKELMGI